MVRIKLAKLIGVWVLIVALVSSPAINIILAQDQGASESASVSLETGEASAVSEATTIVNTTTDEESEIETINLVIQSGSEDERIFGNIANDNEATAEANTNKAAQDIAIEEEVVATTAALAEVDTGNNVQESSQSAVMTTGDGVALATAVAIANTTLIDSSLSVGTISIIAPWDGNLILEPLREAEEKIKSGSIELFLNNSGDVVTIAEASVETGNNDQIASGSSELTTGDTMALSSSASLVNTTFVDVDAIEILAKNLWLWSGMIHNWEYPGSRSKVSEVFGGYSTTSSTECGDECNIALESTASANVTTVAQASVNTGNNEQTTVGSAEMSSGDAIAGATATSVVNTTLINSRIRLLHLLLFSPWTGDLIFAYPDLSIEIGCLEQVAEGNSIHYVLRVKNLGYAKANNVLVKIAVRDTNGPLSSEEKQFDQIGSQDSLEWSFDQPTNGLGGRDVTLEASVSTTDTEETLSNNFGQKQTKVNPINNLTTVNNNDGESDEAPKLWLSATNNIGEYVYPGDKFVYDAEITNIGSITTKEVELVQKLFDPAGQLISEVRGSVGEIKINERKRIKMTLFMAENSMPGMYLTQTYATGKGERSSAVATSNTVTNTIPLRLRTKALNNYAVASENALPVEEVLGSSSETLPFPWECGGCRALPWYLGFMGGTMVYYFFNRRVRITQRVLNRGLAMPITGYIGLLYTNPSCHNGLMMTGNDPWCSWFLPITLFGYYLFSYLLKIGNKNPGLVEIGMAD